MKVEESRSPPTSPSNYNLTQRCLVHSTMEELRREHLELPCATGASLHWQITVSDTVSRTSSAPVRGLPCRQKIAIRVLQPWNNCHKRFTTSGHASRYAKTHLGRKDSVFPDCNKAFHPERQYDATFSGASISVPVSACRTKSKITSREPFLRAGNLIQHPKATSLNMECL